MNHQWDRAKCSTSACVEVADTGTGILMRNSNKPDQILEFTYEEWLAFTLGVKADEFE